MAVWYRMSTCGLWGFGDTMPLCPALVLARETGLPSSLWRARVLDREVLRPEPTAWLTREADFRGLAMACRFVDLSVFISIS